MLKKATLFPTHKGGGGTLACPLTPLCWLSGEQNIVLQTDSEQFTPSPEQQGSQEEDCDSLSHGITPDCSRGSTKMQILWIQWINESEFIQSFEDEGKDPEMKPKSDQH